MLKNKNSIVTEYHIGLKELPFENITERKKICIFRNKFWWRRGNNQLQRAVNSTGAIYWCWALDEFLN